MDTSLNQSDCDNWRNDIQSYLFDLMNDQELFKRTMCSTHSPSTRYQGEDNSATTIIDNNDNEKVSFRERYFRDACQEIIRYQDRHGIRTTSYKNPPEWITQQNSNNDNYNNNIILTPFIFNCIQERHNKVDIWQTDKAADTHLSYLERQWSGNIPWKEFSLQDIEFAQSLYLLESPLITLSTIDRRVLPTWTLQNRARMLPVMKVPHIIDDNKLSVQESLTDHFSISEEERQISINQTVFDALNRLALDPFDNKSTTISSSNDFPDAKDDVIWSDFPGTELFDEQSFLQTWISHPSLENDFSSISISNNNDSSNTKNKSANDTNSGSDTISVVDHHTLGSTITYSNLDYGFVPKNSIVIYNNEKQGHGAHFTNKEYNNTTTTNSLSPSLSATGNKSILSTAAAMMSEYAQQEGSHNKLPLPIMPGTGEEEEGNGCALVNLKPTMYVNPLAGIRRVNEYAGKRRKLEGLTNEEAITDHSKRRKQDSISSVEYYNTNSSEDSSPDLQQQQLCKLRSETSFVEETLSAICGSPIPTDEATPFVTKTSGSTGETRKEMSTSPASNHFSTSINQNTVDTPRLGIHPHYQFKHTSTLPTKRVASEVNQFLTHHERPISSITTAAHAHGHPQYTSQHHNINSNNNKIVHSFSNQKLEQSMSPFTEKNPASANKTVSSSISFSTTADSLPFSRQQKQSKSFFSGHTDNCSIHTPISSFINDDNKIKQPHLGNRYHIFQQQRQGQITDRHRFVNNGSLSVSSWKSTQSNTVTPNNGFSPSANISDFVAMRKVASKGKTNIPHHPSLSSTSTVEQVKQQNRRKDGNNRNDMSFCELRRLHDNLNEKHHFE